MNRPFPPQVQSRFTRTPLYLELLALGQVIGSGTGFVIQTLSPRQYLVTNWHVLSGRNAETRVVLSRHAAIPDQIRIHHHSLADINQREPRIQDLYFDSDRTRPRWLEHPRGHEVDVVLLPLENVEPPVAVSRFNPSCADTGLLELPGLQVSIVGFPYDLHVGRRWPVWKTGHIASDPGYDYDDRPCFLIDITSRTGMSGSPIVFQSPGPFRIRDGEQGINARMEVQFMGVYSGRIHDDAEIARGWRPEAIYGILAAHDIVIE
jgi:hypothetical protein